MELLFVLFLLVFAKRSFFSAFQYGVLIFGWNSFSNHKQKLTLLEKILKFVHFRERWNRAEDNFLKNQLLSVYLLNIYEIFEILKFVFKTINNQHSESYTNIFL